MPFKSLNIVMVVPPVKGVVAVAHSSNPLSIVIPVYKDWDNVTRLLHSLQILRAQGVELIVVAADAETAPSLQRMRPLVDVLCATTAGRARQMNFGAAKARGDVLLFLHADSTVDTALFSVFLERTGLANTWGFFKISLQPSFGLMPLVAALMNLRSRFSGIATGDQGIWVGRELFSAVGGYSDQLLMEDIELCSRLRQRKAPLPTLGTIITSSRRWRLNGQLKTIFSMWWFRLQYWFGADPNKLALIYYPHLNLLSKSIASETNPEPVASADDHYPR